MVGPGRRLIFILIAELFEQIQMLHGDQVPIDGALFDYWYNQDIETITTVIRENRKKIEFQSKYIQGIDPY